MEGVAKMLISSALLGIVGLFFRLYKALVVKPEKLRSVMRKQGISGPPPTFLLGNIFDIKNSRSTAVKTSSTETHNCVVDLFPFFEQWRNQYGEVFLFSLAHAQMLYVNKPDIVKEMTTSTSMDWGKPMFQEEVLAPLVGKGILTANGTVWSRNRKILAPEMSMEKVKGMMGLVVESVELLLNSWKIEVDAAKGGIAEIKIDEHFRRLSGDVISRACFGSSYNKGGEIFLRLKDLTHAISESVFMNIPGIRCIPTKHNRDVRAMEKDIRDMVLKVVKERKESGADENDLLQRIIEGADNSGLSQEAKGDLIVDNCKNIYLAGYDTISISSVWCLMLLAANPDWQARVRHEVVEICKGGTPSFDMLHKMKLLTMVIQESLRLYPPAGAMVREALEDMKFGDIHVPKGLNVWIMMVNLHTDPENWGPDALKFNPERFANGIPGACKSPNMYMPFGRGPRVCLGQHLAMMELKILISQILSNFSFTLSPSYEHSIALRLVIEPEDGVRLLVKRV